MYLYSVKTNKPVSSSAFQNKRFRNKTVWFIQKCDFGIFY